MIWPSFQGELQVFSGSSNVPFGRFNECQVVMHSRLVRATVKRLLQISSGRCEVLALVVKHASIQGRSRQSWIPVQRIVIVMQRQVVLP